MKDMLKRIVRGERTREYVYEIGVKILWATKEFPQNKIMITNYVLALDTNEKVVTAKGTPTKTSVKFANTEDVSQLIRNLVSAYCIVRRTNELEGIKDNTVLNLHKDGIKSMLNKMVDDAYLYNVEGEVKNAI